MPSTAVLIEFPVTDTLRQVSGKIAVVPIFRSVFAEMTIVSFTRLPLFCLFDGLYSFRSIMALHFGSGHRQFSASPASPLRSAEGYDRLHIGQVSIVCGYGRRGVIVGLGIGI